MIFSDKAKDLYDEIKSIEIRDSYVRPKLSSFGGITNGWELISDSWKTRWLELCGADTEKLSDFEKLSAWFDAVRLMPDNALKLIFCEETEAIFGEELGNTDPEGFWRHTADLLNGKNDAVADILRDNNETPMSFCKNNDSVVDNSNESFVDINQDIYALISSGVPLDMGEWSGRIIDRLKMKKPPYELAADIEDMEFIRGDYYHAGQVYKKIKEGASISGEEKAQLFFWLLADIFTKLDGNCLIHLNIGENYGAAHALISYLLMRGISPQIKIGVTPRTSRMGARVCELCLLDPRRISLELVVGMEDSPEKLSARFVELLSYYPADRLSFGGVMTDSVLCFAAHRYAKRVICQALSEIAHENTARAILTKLFM